MENKGFLDGGQSKAMREFISGRDFVAAVAGAASKEKLDGILRAGGISGYTDEMLDECWKNLALSQDMDALGGIFSDKDYESCKAKLAEHGIETTRENFDLINEVLAMAEDPGYVRRLMKMETGEELGAALRADGYTAVTDEFLEMLRENAMSLVKDGILSPEEIRGDEGQPVWVRYFKTINTLFAMATVTELLLGIPGAVAPAYLIAIACGICLI